MASTQPLNILEEKAFAVFETAVEKFVSSVDEQDAHRFLDWLEAHSDDEELLPHLLQTFPRFGTIFADEVELSAMQQPSGS